MSNDELESELKLLIVEALMLDDVDAVYVAHAFLPTSFTLNRVALGTRLPLPQTAAGRAMLAHLEESRRERILAGADFAEFMARSGKDRAGFDEILRETRKRGYAETDSDYVSDVASLAAPVFEPGMGAVTGAVSIIFERGRYSAEDRAGIITHLKGCARHVSSTL